MQVLIRRSGFFAISLSHGGVVVTGFAEPDSTFEREARGCCGTRERPKTAMESARQPLVAVVRS